MADNAAQDAVNNVQQNNPPGAQGANPQAAVPAQGQNPQAIVAAAQQFLQQNPPAAVAVPVQNPPAVVAAPIQVPPQNPPQDGDPNGGRCGYCDLPVNDGRYQGVNCDTCQRWFHYLCIDNQHLVEGQLVPLTQNFLRWFETPGRQITFECGQCNQDMADKHLPIQMLQANLMTLEQIERYFGRDAMYDHALNVLVEIRNHQNLQRAALNLVQNVQAQAQVHAQPQAQAQVQPQAQAQVHPQASFLGSFASTQVQTSGQVTPRSARASPRVQPVINPPFPPRNPQNPRVMPVASGRNTPRNQRTPVTHYSPTGNAPYLPGAIHISAMSRNPNYVSPPSPNPNTEIALLNRVIDLMEKKDNDNTRERQQFLDQIFDGHE